MKAAKNGRIIGYALEDYDQNKKVIELEGAKTEQFKIKNLKDDVEKIKNPNGNNKNNLINAPGEIAKESANAITGKVTDDIAKTNNGNSNNKIRIA